mmetsp:Transcript_23669/g.35520  ORF Transcript_23669/g.35520 Transcript_23669/m.35520 type:complete len:96 (-) Transcript_23669:693-980(-)
MCVCVYMTLYMLDVHRTYISSSPSVRRVPSFKKHAQLSQSSFSLGRVESLKDLSGYESSVGFRYAFEVLKKVIFVLISHEHPSVDLCFLKHFCVF